MHRRVCVRVGQSVCTDAQPGVYRHVPVPVRAEQSAYVVAYGVCIACLSQMPHHGLWGCLQVAGLAESDIFRESPGGSRSCTEHATPELVAPNYGWIRLEQAWLRGLPLAVPIPLSALFGPQFLHL